MKIKLLALLALIILGLFISETMDAGYGHSGGAVAGGFLGGLATGAILSSASRRRSEPAEVVYYEPANNNDDEYVSALESQVADQQDRIERLERKLARK